MRITAKRMVRFGCLPTLVLTLLPVGAQPATQPHSGHPEGAANTSQTEAAKAPGAAPQITDYIIGSDDVLAISVWNEKDISRTVPVRYDGKISLPLIGEIQAAGRTPLDLERDITDRLHNYITSPVVTVIVQEINSKKFNILGEVVKPGSYSLTLAPTVVDAIALAGGFRDFAKRKDVYILRQNADGGQSRIRFNYKKFIKGKHSVQNVHLEPHDTIIVP